MIDIDVLRAALRRTVRRAGIGALAGGIVLSAACDDQPLQVTDTLSQDEAEDLAAAILSLTLDTDLSQVQPATGGPAAVPTTFEHTVEFTTPCPSGGSVDVVAVAEGVVDPDDGTGSLTLALSEAHDACGVTAGDPPTAWTLNGAPGLDIDYDLAWSAAAFEGGGVYDGAVDWSTGDRNGRCVIDLTFDVDGDLEAQTGAATLDGSVCGVSVSSSISY